MDDIQHLRQWIGRKELHHDVATPQPVAAMSATLDRRDPVPRDGNAIPEGWHWLYFLENIPASDLGHDGHTKRGGFLPPVTLPRRMWAGGRLEFRRPIHIGEQLARESEVMSVDAKSGKSGDMIFVMVRHTVRASGEVAVVEEHDIVYRDVAKPGATAAQTTPAAGNPAPAHPAWQHEIMPDEAMLFRYSALIFNAHRIHYDLDFCRAEGYPGLLVHGPLQTTLLLDLCRRHAGKPVRKLDYRAVSPAYHNQKLAVGGIPAADGSHAQIWVAVAGNLTTTGTAHF